MGPWVHTPSSALTTCAAHKVSLDGVIRDGAQDVRILSNLISVVDGRADTHAVGSIGLLEGEFGRTDVLVEGAGGGAAVELAEVGVVDADEGAGDGAEVHIQVVSVHVAEVVKIWPAGVRQSQLDESGWRLSSDPPALNSEVVERSPAVSSGADELAVLKVAASPGPVADGHGVGRHHLDLLGVRGHLPAGLGQEGHAEAAHPDGLVAVVPEAEDSGGLEGAGRHREQNDQESHHLECLERMHRSQHVKYLLTNI